MFSRICNRRFSHHPPLLSTHQVPIFSTPKHIMVGTISGSGRSLAETHSSPCLCLNPILNTGSSNFKTSGELGLWRTLKGRKQLNLSSSFLEAWCEWRLSGKMVSLAVNGGLRKRHKIRKFTVVGGLEVEDDDSGEDVKNLSITLLNLFYPRFAGTIRLQGEPCPISFCSSIFS